MLFLTAPVYKRCEDRWTTRGRNQGRETDPPDEVFAFSLALDLEFLSLSLPACVVAAGNPAGCLKSID